MLCQIPLWQLSKKSLSQQENLQQVHNFLKNNKRKHHHASSINFMIMFLRISIILLVYQTEFLLSSPWMLCFLVLKMYRYFRITLEKKEITEVIIMLVSFHLLDYFTTFLPFMDFLFLIINVVYFMLGIQEKYLAINLMLMDMNGINKSLIIIVLGLGKVKRNTKYTHPFVYLDLGFLLLSGSVQTTFNYLLIALFVQTIKIMDERLILTKKNYTHLQELPNIEQYH